MQKRLWQHKERARVKNASPRSTCRSWCGRCRGTIAKRCPPCLARWLQLQLKQVYYTKNMSRKKLRASHTKGWNAHEDIDTHQRKLFQRRCNMSCDIALTVISAGIPANIQQIRIGVIVSPRKLHCVQTSRCIFPLSFSWKEAASWLVVVPIISVSLGWSNEIKISSKNRKPHKS